MNILRKFFFILVFLISQLSVNCQQAEKRPLDLSQTKYEIWRVSPDLFDKKTPAISYFRVEVNIPEYIKNVFNKLSKSTVIQLLKDPETDWITNLLLYEKYNRDGYLFLFAIKNRQDWLIYKKDEIKYWKSHIKE